MTRFKRKYRELDDEVKKKISVATKGKKKSFSHRQHIAQSMVNYWKSVEHRPDYNNGSQTFNNEEK